MGFRFFQSKGFKLTLKPAENDINMSKLVDEEIYSYPYYTISETMQRVVFYMLAIKTNKIQFYYLMNLKVTLSHFILSFWPKVLH